MYDIAIQVVILVVGLALLAKSSDIIINSSIRLAKMFKISEFVIGFLLISIATSLPELAVSLDAIFSGNVGISIGNLFGSNIANISLILGIAAIFVPIIIKKEDLHDLTTILFLTSFFPLVLVSAGFASKFVGVALLASFFMFGASLLRKQHKLITQDHYKVEGLIPKKVKKDYKQVLFFAVGVALLLISANYVVSSALSLSVTFGLAQSLVGATIIALGTSLPELAVTISAVRQKKFTLVIGNIVGSSMTNIALILGLVLVAAPFTINIAVFSNLVTFLILTNILLWYFINNEKIERTEGIALIIFYQIFLIITLFLGT